MSTFKKLLALTLALAMVLSVSAFAGYSKDTYKDAAAINEDCEEAIELMYALKIMKGDNNGNFNPEATITRAEMVKMIYVILNYGKDDLAVNYKGAKIFADVNAGDWFEGYVNFAATTKLVQGRGNGTFGPNDPVTTAEAAKMLLTAIGYSAEARGYTGANWAQNVLSDAQILGLLKGYNYSTTGYAPRQWVAVMVENALGCYTFDTMRPTFSGLLVSGEAQSAYDTMGRKYYDLAISEAYLIATDSVYIDQLITCETEHTHNEKCARTTTAPDYCLRFSNGLVIESSELGYMDLGQKFRVIYDYDDNDEVYSIRPITSVVADSIVMDIEVENTYATNKNDAKNKYEFTIGDMTAKFDSYTVKALVVSDKVATSAFTMNADELKAAAGAQASDLVRAIDKNADGDIDYVILVKYAYGAVTKVGEHAHYGEYFNAKNAIGGTYKPAGFTGDKWYLSDVVNTEDEIVKGNYIKVNYNPDNGKYDVEVLPVAEAVTYEKRTNKGVHTLGGEEYVVADNGFEYHNNVLKASNLKDAMDLVYDGTLAVYAEVCDSDYTDLADINAQLVMVTKLVIDEYVLGGDRAYIDYMTIDGETHKEVRYVDGKDTAKDTDDANVNVAELEIHLANNMRLFVLVESGDSVYLKKLTPDAWVDADNSQAILDYSSSLLTGYTEETDILDTADNEFGEDFVANENKFFVAYIDSDGDLNFAVMSLDDMGEGVDKAAFAQALYKTKRQYDTYLAGYFYLPNLELNAATGYLYSTTGDVYLDDYYGDYVLTDVFFNDGAEEGVEIFVSDDEVKANCLYSYTYEKVNGEKVYTLTLVDELSEDYSAGNRCDVSYSKNSFSDPATKYELINAYVADNGDEIVVADHASGREKLTMASSYDVVLKKVVLDRDENQNGLTDDDLYFSIDSEIAFTTFADLIEEDEDGVSVNRIYNGESDDTYNYYSDYYWVKNTSGNVKMLYVITYAVEIEAQN